MAAWDSADLLARCYMEAKRPSTDTSTSDAEWYQRLSVAQDQWITVFAQHCPHVLVGAPELVTSSDGGETYDLDYYPLGGVELRHGRRGEILIPGPEFSDAADFTIEGQTIRIPNGQTRSFANGLYARYVPTGTVISASVEPTFQPPWARQLLVLQAVADWAREGGLRDPAPYLQKLQHRAWGDPMNPGDTGVVGGLKQQYYAQGVLSPEQQAYWWRQWS